MKDIKNIKVLLKSLEIGDIIMLPYNSIDTTIHLPSRYYTTVSIEKDTSNYFSSLNVRYKLIVSSLTYGNLYSTVYLDEEAEIQLVYFRLKKVIPIDITDLEESDYILLNAIFKVVSIRKRDHKSYEIEVENPKTSYKFFVSVQSNEKVLVPVKSLSDLKIEEIEERLCSELTSKNKTQYRENYLELAASREVTDQFRECQFVLGDKECKTISNVKIHGKYLCNNCVQSVAALGVFSTKDKIQQFNTKAEPEKDVHTIRHSF